MATANDRNFLSRLQESEEDREFLAAYFRSYGDDVELPPLRVRPSVKQHAEYADHGDMLVTIHFSQHLQQAFRMEGKKRQFHFTCRRDWPYSDLVLCNCDSLARAEVEHRLFHFYVHMNQSRTYVAIIRASSKPTWRRRPITDGERGTTTDNWCVPLSKVQFAPLAKLRECLLMGEQWDKRRDVSDDD